MISSRKLISTCISICCLCILLASTQIVKLDNKYHLYELKIERSDELKSQDQLQSFRFLVGGDGKCSKVIDEWPSYKPAVKWSSNNVKPLIYTNFENTLSFMIEIGFETNYAMNNYELEGFELVFDTDESTSSQSCIQIIPLNKATFKSDETKFKLTIKDPSFLNVRNPLFTFYFGRVSIRSLVSCPSDDSDESMHLIGERRLCSPIKTQTTSYDIGIESRVKVELDDFKADICPSRSVVHQTCILKYTDANANTNTNTYYIIIQPAPPGFNLTIGDINFQNLTPRQREAWIKAKEAGLKEYEFLGRKYKTSETEPESHKMMAEIELKSEQKLANGLIMKMFEYDSDEVHYVSYLNTPNTENKCFNSTRREYCWCEEKCTKCYENLAMAKVIYYIPLHDNRKERSLACDTNEQLKAYDFSKTEMRTSFHGQNPADKRMSINRNLLPSFCFSSNLNDVTSLYNVKLIFNDYQQAAMSTLLYNTTRFSFKLYRIEFKDVSTPGHPIEIGEYIGIKSPPHLLYSTNENLRLTDVIELHDLNLGRYVLEVSVKQMSNEICKNENECIDESNRNNELFCIKCNKILTVFTLIKETSSNKASHLDKKLMNCERGNFKASISASIDYSAFKTSNEKFICSFTSLYAPKLTNANRNIRTFDHIYSLVVADDFNLNTLKLPYTNVGQDLFCDGNDSLLAIISTFVVYFGLFFLPLLSIVFLAFLIYFCLVVCMEYKIRRKAKLNVVFFLSIYVNDDDLKKLDYFITRLVVNLKKKFLIDATFEIIKRPNIKEVFKRASTKSSECSDASTRSSTTTHFNSSKSTATTIIDLYKSNSKLLDKADLITYVCGSKQEVDELMGEEKTKNRFKAFGSSYDEHLYMRLRKCDHLKAKTIFITFNTIVKATRKKNVCRETSRNFVNEEIDRKPLLSSSVKNSSILLYLLPKQSRQYLEQYFKRLNQLSYKYSSSPKTKFKRLVNKLLQSIYTTPFIRTIHNLFKENLKVTPELFTMETNSYDCSNSSLSNILYGDKLRSNKGKMLVSTASSSSSSSYIVSTSGSSINTDSAINSF